MSNSNSSSSQKFINFLKSDKTDFTIEIMSKLLDHTPPSKFINDYRSKPKLKLKDMLAIYAVSGIKPKDYEVDVDLDLSMNPRILNDGEEFLEFLSFSDWNKNPNNEAKDYSQQYYDRLISALDKCKKDSSILVYDYFLNNVSAYSKEEIRKFFKGYRAYLEKIEEIVEEKNIKYNRIIALPFYSNNLLNYGEYQSEKYALAISLLSKAFYQHILRCYKKYPSKFSFSITDEPSRTYSTLIIGNQYIACEYYRLKKSRTDHIIKVPDLLFIEKGANNNPIERLIKIYRNEFRKFHQHPLSFEEFKASTKRAISIVEEKCKGFKNKNDVDSLGQLRSFKCIQKNLNANLNLLK